MWHISVFKIQLENSKKYTSSAQVLTHCDQHSHTVMHTHTQTAPQGQHKSFNIPLQKLYLVYHCPHCVSDPQCELQYQCEH